MTVTRRHFLQAAGLQLTALSLPFHVGTGHATEAVWQKLRAGGYTVLIRHTRAPGTGDPNNFSLDDCSTQRNLSQRGRLEARRMGARIAASGVIIQSVFTSQWCRCRQTAELAFENIAPIEDFPALNSFFRDRSTQDAQTNDVLEAIRAFNGTGNQVMVTHQVNITALTGVFPREGELVIVQPSGDSLDVVGRLTF